MSTKPRYAMTRAAYEEAKRILGRDPKDEIEGLEIVEDGDQEYAPGKAVVLCRTVKSGPAVVPGAYMDNCSKCGQRVWVSPTSPLGLDRVCAECAPEDVVELARRAMVRR